MRRRTTRGQITGPVFPRRITFHGALQHPAIGLGRRQAVGLLSLTQLQPVLQMPQELVGAGEIVKFFAADVALVMQLMQREQSSARPQPGFRAAIHPLQALHQKFNIADATAIDLHINGLVRVPGFFRTGAVAASSRAPPARS